MEGFEVTTLEDTLGIGDIYVTTTGNCDVITFDHIRKLKDKEPDGKFRGALFSGKRPDGAARRWRIPFMGLRLRSNEARRPSA